MDISHRHTHRSRVAVSGLQEDPGILAHPSHSTGTRTRTQARPHVHSQCLRELLGAHSASAADWPPTASSARLQGLAVAPNAPATNRSPSSAAPPSPAAAGSLAQAPQATLGPASPQLPLSDRNWAPPTATL